MSDKIYFICDNKQNPRMEYGYWWDKKIAKDFLLELNKEFWYIGSLERSRI
jgi:hypothetical protein